MTPEQEQNPYSQRAEELASVLAGLLGAWDALPDSDRINIVRGVHRNLIDLTCEIESA